MTKRRFMANSWGRSLVEGIQTVMFGIFVPGYIMRENHKIEDL